MAWLSSESALAPAQSSLQSALADSGGRIPALPLAFRFLYRGTRFAAVAREEGEGASLTLTAVAGHLPYTAESAFARAALSDILTIAGSFPRFRPLLGAGHELSIAGELAIEGAPTPDQIAATTVAGVVSIKPLIDLLRMLLPPGAEPPTPVS